MKRFHYARFTENGVEQLGSDSYLPLDRRLGLALVIDACQSQRLRLRAVKPWYNGVNLYASPLSCHAAGEPAQHIELCLP